MSQLIIYKDTLPALAIFNSTDKVEISNHLSKVNIVFKDNSQRTVTSQNKEAILTAHDSVINSIALLTKYKSRDLVSVDESTPNKADLRAKYMFEHTHNEDEVRFFVDGRALFCLHIGSNIYQVICEKGDLISIPKDTAHWFDMGSNPNFSVIRFFMNEKGWIASATGSDIAAHFPTLDQIDNKQLS
ncbi:acireductone dioxygenase [Saccharobesus litoralis]|uniref:Acireductone dioxygenase n=1 Tax=Saccharobesus litoralis TaxID=2172099 RepID=A0A2S0VWI2_9ALTE|nr:cupin domain-containing protein [Saccharobesus litoralis]AWB68571.1 acireductone dioxygenase [Saccharobesus litoralis]